MKAKYEAWSDDGQVSFADPEAIKKEIESGALGKTAKLLHVVEADTWEEAMAVHHIKMGWEPYKPEGEAEECPNGCGSFYYPKGSGQCPKCGVVC